MRNEDFGVRYTIPTSHGLFEPPLKKQTDNVMYFYTDSLLLYHLNFVPNQESCMREETNNIIGNKV